MTKRLLLALAVCLASMGCAAPVLHRDITILPPEAATESVIVSVNRHVEAWEDDFGRSIPPVEIEIMPGQFICADVSSIGCTVGNHIKVTRTYNSSPDGLPALYHELCHAGKVSAYGTDANHQDGRWSKWTQRSLALGDE